MKYLEKAIDEDCGYLIPIGDIHWGDKAFKDAGLTKLKGYLDWVMERPNAFVFLMGDIFNTAGRNSKTTPFETDNEEYVKAVEFFNDYKERIIGAIDGNHEYRMYDEFGISPLQLFCRELQVPYCKYSAVIRFKVGKRKDKNAGNRFMENYFVFAHHTTGGGGTIGGKMNRVAKEAEMIEGCDVYLGAHNHQLGVIPQDIYYPSIQGGIQKRRRWFVDCGSYLEHENSYAEKGMLAPAKLGSPRIRFDAKSHDCHISL
jgi:hypothetical protein